MHEFHMILVKWSNDSFEYREGYKNNLLYEMKPKANLLWQIQRP